MVDVETSGDATVAGPLPRRDDGGPSLAGKLARYFHLKNTRPAADGAGPMPPGGSLESGVLDYRSILAAAFAAGYAGPLTIEFLSFERKPVEEKLASDVRFVRTVLAELGRA